MHHLILLILFLLFIDRLAHLEHRPVWKDQIKSANKRWR